MSLNQDNLNKLITQALDIEAQEAKEAGALGFMARVLTQATMPHSDPKISIFKRSNGNFSLCILGHPEVGLPYGTYPRLILNWLVTEAVRTKTPELILGSNLNKFLDEIGLKSTGGRWGSIARLRNQLRRLFSSSISCTYEGENHLGGLGFNIAKEYQLWWDPKKPQQNDLWKSKVILSLDFFNEIIDRPIPIDMRAIRSLKTSSMALDLYCWLTYRLSYLKNKTEIPWPLLQNQFGSEYANTKQGRYEFKRQLISQLRKVAVIYKDAATVQQGKYGLVLAPSLSHIKK